MSADLFTHFYSSNAVRALGHQFSAEFILQPVRTFRQESGRDTTLYDTGWGLCNDDTDCDAGFECRGGECWPKIQNDADCLTHYGQYTKYDGEGGCECMEDGDGYTYEVDCPYEGEWGDSPDHVDIPGGCECKRRSVGQQQGQGQGQGDPCLSNLNFTMTTYYESPLGDFGIYRIAKDYSSIQYVTRTGPIPQYIEPSNLNSMKNLYKLFLRWVEKGSPQGTNNSCERENPGFIRIFPSTAAWMAYSDEANLTPAQRGQGVAEAAKIAYINSHGGCMDSDAPNYDANALVNDGSCEWRSTDSLNFTTYTTGATADEFKWKTRLRAETKNGGIGQL